MLKKEDIEYLSTLARITISDEEKDSFATQLDSVLSYVSDISKVSTTEAANFTDATPFERAGVLRNVMRADDNVSEGGKYTADILANAPDTEDGYVKVRKII